MKSCKRPDKLKGHYWREGVNHCLFCGEPCVVDWGKSDIETKGKRRNTFDSEFSRKPLTSESISIIIK